MAPENALPPETILIVDDEDPIRKTFREWLESAHFGVTILSAADAETALTLANEQPIDLAILDWNLGAGNDGLQLLEDLYEFNPALVAIMITGYAHQATPLDAMRKGVRDYLDKNQDLNRSSFLRAVQRQLEFVRPARRERRLLQGLVTFREAVEQVLPLVQTSAALHDPLSLPEVITSLFRFLLQLTQATAGVLLVRTYDTQRQPVEICCVYEASGKLLDTQLVPFSTSLAGMVVSLNEPRVLNQPAVSGAALHPFERDKKSILLVPLRSSNGLQVVLELFDRPGGFGETERQLAATAADLGSQMLIQAISHRETGRVLFNAVTAALRTSETVEATLHGTPDRPPEPVLEPLRHGWKGGTEETLPLVEAIRALQLRHGTPALQHCLHLIDSLRRLLDNVAGMEESGT